MTTAAGPSVAVPAGYAPLDASAIPGWLDGRPALRAKVPGPRLDIREVGDGNLNLVFVVRDDPSRPGLVLKQSLPWVRVHGEGWPLTIERARHEAEAYRAYEPFAGSAIPRQHGFDGEAYVLAMEDLGDLRVWRAALNDGEVHADAAVTLGRLVAGIAFWTSDAGLPPDVRKARLAASVNPELCRITEDLVFTEPYIEHEHNWYGEGLEWLVAELRTDEALLTEVGLLKHRFLTAGEALIHGDLHTGSVMVGGGRTVAIDPEFAFYGPVGFDLGALWANALIAAARADRLDRSPTFRAHVASILPDSWDAFKDELRRLWPGRLDRSLGDGVLERRLEEIWQDGLGFAGVKAIRRLIGYAHVSDIETLEPPVRASAAAAVLRAARRWLIERPGLSDPRAAWAVVTEELAR